MLAEEQQQNVAPATAGLQEALRDGNRRAGKSEQEKQGCCGMDQAPDKEIRDAQKARVHGDILVPSWCLEDDAQGSLILFVMDEN